MNHIMQKRIGIIAAMEEEMSAVKARMRDVSESAFFDKTFFLGYLGNCMCILVQCGIGKVNAARTAQLMIDQFHITHLINVGTAGALNYDLDYLDIIISTSCIQTDFDLTVFHRELGELPEIGRYICASPELISVLKKAILETDSKHHVVEGIIATSDQFINDPEIKKKHYHLFHAECDEMEGAAIAQTAFLCRVPFVIIRSVTDKPNHKKEVDFYHYLEQASYRCAAFLEKALTQL